MLQALSSILSTAKIIGFVWEGLKENKLLGKGVGEIIQ
jgi:hypothetical protein